MRPYSISKVEIDKTLSFANVSAISTSMLFHEWQHK